MVIFWWSFIVYCLWWYLWNLDKSEEIYNKLLSWPDRWSLTMMIGSSLRQRSFSLLQPLLIFSHWNDLEFSPQTWSNNITLIVSIVRLNHKTGQMCMSTIRLFTKIWGISYVSTIVLVPHRLLTSRLLSRGYIRKFPLFKELVLCDKNKFVKIMLNASIISKYVRFWQPSS